MNSSADKKTYVVYSSDNRGVLPLSVSFYSLLETSRNPKLLDITVLSDGIADDNLDVLARLAESFGAAFRVIDIQEMLLDKDLPESSNAGWPQAIWGRLFIPELIKTRGNVVYLDIDTLVCRPIEELAETDLGEKILGAVIESYDSERCPGIVAARKERKGELVGYFNSGILVITVENFVQFDTINKLVEYARNNMDKLVCHDQDVLNELLFDHTLALHPRWNWHDGTTRRMVKYSMDVPYWRGIKPLEGVEAAINPGVLHYQGPNKPWFYNHRIEGERYKQAMIRGGFLDKGAELPGATFGKRLKSLLYRPLYFLTWNKIRKMAEKAEKSTSGQ